MFTLLIYSKRKNLDPSNLMDYVVDDTGNRVTTNNETTIEEYLFYFLARIEEAIKL